MKKKTPKKGRMDMSQRALSIVKKATHIDSLTEGRSKKAGKRKSPNH